MITNLTNYLRRFTELPFLLDYLHTKEIAIPSPSTWDDRNDAYYVDLYRSKKGCESAYALCMTQSAETYHHWKIFSSGPSAICIEFHRDAFLEHAARADKTILLRQMEYRTLKSMRDDGIEIKDLPFTKRKAFEDEREFRAVMVKKTSCGPVYRLPMPISTVNRVILGPWIPMPVAKYVKASLLKVPGCSKVDVMRSNLTENPEWKRIAEHAA
jgi:hypothetical protein